MQHVSSLLNSSLYLNKISLSKEILKGNYLRDLPAEKEKMKLSKEQNIKNLI